MTTDDDSSERTVLWDPRWEYIDDESPVSKAAWDGAASVVGRIIGAQIVAFIFVLIVLLSGEAWTLILLFPISLGVTIYSIKVIIEKSVEITLEMVNDRPDDRV